MPSPDQARGDPASSATRSMDCGSSPQGHLNLVISSLTRDPCHPGQRLDASVLPHHVIDHGQCCRQVIGCELHHAINLAPGVGKNKMRVVGKDFHRLRSAARVRGDAGAEELDAAAGAGRIRLVGLDMADPILVHITPEHDRVGDLLLAQ